MTIWQSIGPPHCEDCLTELPATKKRQPTVCRTCLRKRSHTEADSTRFDRYLREALNEIAPMGLTDDCPARKSLRRAA